MERFAGAQRESPEPTPEKFWSVKYGVSQRWSVPVESSQSHIVRPTFMLATAPPRTVPAVCGCLTTVSDASAAFSPTTTTFTALSSYVFFGVLK